MNRNGRKPLLFLPVFCQLLQCLSFILNYVFMVELDWRFMYLELVMELGMSGQFKNDQLTRKY